jgi:gliding motility-associated-like protein
VLNSLPATGTWILTRHPGEVTITGTGSNTIISGLSPGTYTFNVTSQSGCISAISKSLVIPATTAFPGVIITDPAATCSTDGTDLTAPGITAGSSTGLTFTYWTNAAATIAYPTPESAGAGTYYIKGTATTGCYDIKPVTIKVAEVPQADAGKDQLLFNQFGTTMEAGLLQNNETGTWSVVSGSAEFLDRKNPRTPVINLSVNENKLLWKVTNGICPESNDTVMIRVNNLKIQTLITPNMDGKNDYFEVNGLNTSGSTELVVFDRRGLQVYKNSNYDNTWNGVDYNENPLQDDTYFYVIRTNDGKSIKGFVVIRR